jgi:hypothetical protein
MRHMIESGVARVGAALQNLGTHMDYEVLALPGGSVIAVLLALYGSAMDSMGHEHAHPDAPAKATSGIDGEQTLIRRQN